jgi:RNA 2',3'-cyclic 3'-phosphodiesterase
MRNGLWDAIRPLRDLDLPVKWVRPEGIHLTLKFLGDVEDTSEAELRAALGSAAGAGEPRGITLQVDGFGAFPDARRARVIWAGVTPEPALELLQHRVEQAFAPLGFPTEARAFRPHVTLGRAARDARPRDLAALEPALDSATFTATALVATVDLMQSTLESRGAVYHVKHRERLS